jgi:hypothetical protein
VNVEPMGGPFVQETRGSRYRPLGPSNINLTLLDILTCLHFTDSHFWGSKLILILWDTRAPPR